MFVLRALTTLDQMLMHHLVQQHAAVCYELARISWRGELDLMRSILISAAAGQPEPVPIWRGTDDGNWQRMQFAAEVLSVEFEPCRCILPHPIVRNLFICAKVIFGRLWLVSICIVAACGLNLSTFSLMSTSCQVIACI
jgi:hypothetical protein